MGFPAAAITGHVADYTELSLSDKHIESVRKLNEPESGDFLTRFLCVVNFFAEFVDHFAETPAQ